MQYLSRHATRGSGTLQVIKYINSYKVVVRFVTTGYIRSTSAVQIRRGTVKDPYYPAVRGIGYIGEGRFLPSTETGCGTKLYNLWKNVLSRVGNSDNKHAAYINVRVCTDWLCFQTFAEHVSSLPFAMQKGYDLDKDFLGLDKDIYSPDTAAFVPNSLNRVFTTRLERNIVYRPDLLPNRPYRAQIVQFKGRTHCAYFPTFGQAKRYYLQQKLQYIKDLAITNRHVMDKRVYDCIEGWTYSTINSLYALKSTGV